jgi:hypothetical protein
MWGGKVCRNPCAGPRRELLIVRVPRRAHRRYHIVRDVRLALDMERPVNYRRWFFIVASKEVVQVAVEEALRQSGAC